MKKATELLGESLFFAALLCVIGQLHTLAFGAVHCCSCGVWPEKPMTIQGCFWAGFSEEAVYRLAAIPGLIAIGRFIKISTDWSKVMAVVTAAIWFSWAHHQYGDPFTWCRFLFRIEAGVLFGILFLRRGFWTAMWTHSFYDVLIVSIRWLDSSQ